MVVNDPTAYIVLPHWTSCRTRWVCPARFTSAGVPAAGVPDTGPVGAAAAGTASTAAAVSTVPSVARRYQRPAQLRLMIRLPPDVDLEWSPRSEVHRFRCRAIIAPKVAHGEGCSIEKFCQRPSR